MISLYICFLTDESYKNTRRLTSDIRLQEKRINEQSNGICSINRKNSHEQGVRRSLQWGHVTTTDYELHDLLSVIRYQSVR